MSSTFADHFRMLGRYNTIANQRLYTACAELSDADYRAPRSGSFGSIHATLNHILAGDRIWMGRFREPGVTHATPALGALIADDFDELREARIEEDAGIEKFLDEDLDAAYLELQIHYVNSAGYPCQDPVPLLLAHMFNHQTHHRGQIHAMLAQSPVKPPALDMHRAVRPIRIH